MNDVDSRPQRRPTIIDVAAVAGVSRGTVSRYLNGGRWVSPEAREAVEAAITETGYQINMNARSLITGRSNSIAYLLTEPQHFLFEDPNYARLLKSVTDASAERDITVVLMSASTAEERRRVVNYVHGGRVDGVLLISPHKDDPLITDLQRNDVPVVACGLPLGFEGRLAYVSADDRAGGHTMTRHLMAQGRTRIATITGPMEGPGGQLRLEGYRDALGAAFDPELVVHGEWSSESGAAKMEELLGKHPDIDAVFAHSDLIAIGAIETLQKYGRRVPTDVSVGGFDDIGLAAKVTPSLTTMHVPYERMSEDLFQLLMKVIDGEEPSAVTLPTTLIARESA